MRLHRLEVTAFGPFARHQVVDFDQLSAAGLFLLHGPTGSGKTSVLDAICFALYGRVPGVRGSLGRLRSDHADLATAPEVVCDFTVSGRRFEITRSPEWLRPKKRGTGMIREQAHVVVRELRAGEWIGLTNRIDEAADLLDQVIGLGAEQFTKLILLPQGDFAAFLRATAEERRPLLQKLFGTDRFAEVERWLADRRREFEHHIHTAGTSTARLFARAEEARLPVSEITIGDADQPDLHAVESVAALVLRWAGEAKAERTVAHREVRAAERHYEAARQRTELAGETVARLARQAELGRQLVGLLAEAPAVEQRRTAVAAAGHAVVLAPLLADLTEAGRRVAAASQRSDRARAAVLAAGDDPDLTGADRVSELREQLGGLAGLLEAARDLERLDAEQSAREQQIATAEHDREQADQRLAELTTAQAELAAQRSGAELIAVTRPDREHDSARAKAVAHAVVEQEQLALEQTAAQDALRAAIDGHQAAVAASQELRARRLEGMAAELAAGLSGEAPCPVCGSAEHPAPAAPTAAPVTERAQQRAEKAEATALAERESAQAVVNDLAQRWAALQAVTEGASAETAAARLIEAESRVVEARSAQTRVQQLGTELDAVEGRMRQALEQQKAAVARAASGREALAENDGRRSDLRGRLDAARGTDADVPARYRRLQVAVDAGAEWVSAQQAAAEAAQAQGRAQASAEQAATAAGFPDLAAAGAALLPESERAAQVAQLAEHDAQVSRLRALLADVAAEIAAAQVVSAEVVAAGEVADAEVVALAEPADSAEAAGVAAEADPAVVSTDTGQLDLFGLLLNDSAGAEQAHDVVNSPDAPATTPEPAQPEAVPPKPSPKPSPAPEPLTLDQLRELQPELREQQARARDAHEAARERHTLAGRAARALAGLADELDAHAAATGPLRRQFAALDSVSKCVEGTGGDNALRMRLSSYVLAARLEQVAEAASIRLAAMSGGRYLLVHTDGPSRGGARSGLGLAVIDGWTGVQRDPASLSGGETFCTSLALALGLADVVQAEAGGSVIETLLVDEGFGSLDEQTLDEVMDVLDGLRSAGRSVGLVSHVADLRDRIPAQLRVHKTRTGSQLIA
jgi:exonuclease SbcC